MLFIKNEKVDENKNTKKSPILHSQTHYKDPCDMWDFSKMLSSSRIKSSHQRLGKKTKKQSKS